MLCHINANNTPLCSLLDIVSPVSSLCVFSLLVFLHSKSDALMPSPHGILGKEIK